MAKPGRPKKEKVIETPVEVIETPAESILKAPPVEEPMEVEVVDEEITEVKEIPDEEPVTSRDAYEGCAISYATVAPQVTHPIMLQING